MNKVTIFEGISRFKLERAINDFANRHKIVNTSISTKKYGDSTEYIIVVLYEE